MRRRARLVLCHKAILPFALKHHSRLTILQALIQNWNVVVTRGFSECLWTWKLHNFIPDLQCKLLQMYCLLQGCWRPRRCNVPCRPRRLRWSPAWAGHHPSRSVCQESCAAPGLHRTTWQRRRNFNMRCQSGNNCFALLSRALELSPENSNHSWIDTAGFRECDGHRHHDYPYLLFKAMLRANTFLNFAKW